MGQKYFIWTLLSLLMISSSPAAADDLEKDLEKEVRESRAIILSAKTKGKVDKEGNITAAASKLKHSADNIHAVHLLLEERFKAHGVKAAALGGKATERQNKVVEGYRKAIEDYLALIDTLPSDGTVAPMTLDYLKTLLDGLVPPKKNQLLGALPYKHLAYPAREPATTPTVIPAYKGGNRSVAPADTAASADVVISKDIADLAQSLQWNPVLIYEWVKNNVETEWYWGSMKGSEETLRQKSGNDADQAALLVALLRASNFPARFVKGTIEFFPDMERIKNITGIDDPIKIAAFFQKAGIPFKPVIGGGGITNFHVEHIWVESEIPYSNYRGAVIDDFGKTWIALDTSIKTAGYNRNAPADLPGFPFETLRDDYLQTVQTLTPLEFLKARTEEYLGQDYPGKTWQDLLSIRNIIADVLKILPSSLQFKQVAITGEYTALPSELKHQVKISAVTPAGNELFTITLDLQRLSNQRFTLSYEPETVEDQQIIDSFGGIDNTPGYLVRLRPVLKLNGERMVVAGDGLAMGAEYILIMETITPNGSEQVSNTHLTGNLAVIGIVAQQAAALSPIAEGDSAEAILFKLANSYVDQWNRAEDELAALLKLAVCRPVPTIVTVGGLIDVTWLLDMPHGFEWKGVFIDAALRGIETVTRTGEVARERSFMTLSALQGSILENKIFEDTLLVESISTAKLLALGNASQAPLVNITRADIDTVLPTLPFDETVRQDISNAVNQNFRVMVPQSEMFFMDWTGIGYLKENRETGESGWMLSGHLAGGVTAEDADAWKLAGLAGALKAPYSGPPNTDPMAAAKVLRMRDFINGTAGKQLQDPLAVQVLDANRRPVQNVPVRFRSISGGGTLELASGNGEAPSTEVIAVTGLDGVAKVLFTPGKSTADAPLYIYSYDQTHPEMVGQNLVDVFAMTRVGEIEIDKPLEIYGYPGVARSLVKVAEGETDNQLGDMNAFAGSIWVKVIDENENPIANKQVTFTVVSPLFTELSEGKRTAMLFSDYSQCPGLVTQLCMDRSKSPLKKMTNSMGAIASVMMGNTAGAEYEIEARVAADEILNGHRIDQESEILPPQFFHYYTYGVGGRADSARGYITSAILEHVNENGERSDAGKVGHALGSPLTVLLYSVMEETDDDYVEPDPVCNNSCYRVKRKGTFATSLVTNGVVDFKVVKGAATVDPPIFPVQSGAIVENGRYFTGLTFSSTPESNDIEARAEAVIPVAAVDVATGQPFWDQRTFTSKAYTRYWGIEPSLAADHWVLLNDAGYPTADVPLRYSVMPEEYPASRLMMTILENKAPIGYLPIERSGGILSRGGARFSPGAAYSADLTVGGVTSESVPLQVAAIDLDVDSRNRGRFNSDGTYQDPAQTADEDAIEDDADKPGKWIPINTANADKDREQNLDLVPDFADGYDKFPVHAADNASAPFVPIALRIPSQLNVSQVKIRFSYTASDPDGVVQSGDATNGFIYTAAPGHLRVWTKDGITSRKKASANNGGDYVKPGDVYSLSHFGSKISENTWRLYLEGVAASADPGEERIVVEIDPDGDGPAGFMEGDAVRATVVKPLLITDYNRDRTIDDKDRVRAALGDTFYFWVNDDNDGSSMPDDNPDGKYPDWEKKPEFGADGNPTGDSISIVDDVRDLEDFIPIFIDVAEFMKIFDPAAYNYVLRSTDESMNFAFTALMPETAGNYLIDVPTAENLRAARTYQIKNDGIILNGHDKFLDRIKNEGKGVILVEGRKASISPLELVVKEAESGKTVFISSLNLHLAYVEQMFRHVNLTQSIGNDSAPAIETGEIGEHKAKGGEKNRKESPTGFPDAETDEKYIVMIHGFNNDGQVARGWHSEMFKRLFWSGSRTRFVGMTWYGHEDVPNYQQNVVNAFSTAAQFGQNIVKVTDHGPVTIMAHSLGNIVASSYLCDYHQSLSMEDRPNVKNYVMLNAAVALEAYLGDYNNYAEGKKDEIFGEHDQHNEMVHPFWYGYQKRFAASEWHQLFDLEDQRRMLTWRNRFEKMPSGINYYSFYSTGEDVLATHIGVPEAIEAVKNALFKGGRYAWAFQEKWKGRGLTNGMGATTTMGWGFNLTDEVFNPKESPDTTTMYGNLNEATANSTVGDMTLRNIPFFKKAVPDSVPNDLFEEGFNVDLQQYFIRSPLLGKAIPALTTPVGGARGIDMNFRSYFNREYIIDMNDTGIKNGWPIDRSNDGDFNWKHSDIKSIPYTYSHKIFDMLAH